MVSAFLERSTSLRPFPRLGSTGPILGSTVVPIRFRCEAAVPVRGNGRCGSSGQTCGNARLQRMSRQRGGFDTLVNETEREILRGRHQLTRWTRQLRAVSARMAVAFRHADPDASRVGPPGPQAPEDGARGRANILQHRLANACDSASGRTLLNRRTGVGLSRVSSALMDAVGGSRYFAPRYWTEQPGRPNTVRIDPSGTTPSDRDRWMTGQAVFGHRQLALKNAGG